MFVKFLRRQISLLTKELTTRTKKKKFKKRPKREVKNRGCPPLSKRPSPFFFHLAWNAFPDIGLVGRIEKKNIKKNKQEVSEDLVPQGDVKG